jgi:hypothetical protein
MRTPANSNNRLATKEKEEKKKNERTEFLRISTEKESLLDVPD